MQFKSFDELSIQDNFIFEKVMREKSICKELLERVLEISIRDIAYIETEKTMESGLDEKGIRLEMYTSMMIKELCTILKCRHIKICLS